MKIQIDVHPAQAEILNTLLFKPSARFRDLNQTGLSNNHFTFHLKELVKFGLVTKREGNTYSLTSLGKEFANRFDTEEKQVERQAKLGVLIVPRKVEGKRRLYLIQERLKHPYYGFFGWPTGKIKWGERILAAGERELREETGLSGTLALKGVWHKTDYTKEKRLLEDKYFFVVEAKNLRGNLIEDFDGGKNFWMTRAELRKQMKVFEGVEKAIDIAEGDKLAFVERDYFYTDEEY